jgi:outer membrane protein assembly factor BamE (lipoprotein component of BamABCDE complex)
MTKAEVRKRYGEPVEIARTPQGEVWYYVARVRGRDFIPVYGAITARRKGGSIGFDSRGRVSAFQWGRDYRNAWWY